MFGFIKSGKGQTLTQAYPEVNLPNTGYNANNQYNKFPPLMNDGRSVLASWQPGAVVNESILKKEGIQSNWQYRQYMTTNSNALREQMHHDALNDVGYTMRNEMEAVGGGGFKGPKVYSSIEEPVSHVQAMPSDLKANYLSREQLQSKMNVQTFTQEQLMQQWQNQPK